MTKAEKIRLSVFCGLLFTALAYSLVNAATPKHHHATRIESLLQGWSPFMTGLATMLAIMAIALMLMARYEARKTRVDSGVACRTGSLTIITGLLAWAIACSYMWELLIFLSIVTIGVSLQWLLTRGKLEAMPAGCLITSLLLQLLVFSANH